VNIDSINSSDTGSAGKLLRQPKRFPQFIFALWTLFPYFAEWCKRFSTTTLILGEKYCHYSAGPSHREGAERPRRSHVKNPALPEEIAALVRDDFFFQIKSRYELDASFASVQPRHILTPHIGLVARGNPASRHRIPGRS